MLKTNGRVGSLILFFCIVVSMCTNSFIVSASSNYDYIYDAAGRLDYLKLPAGEIVDYQYDINKNLTKIVPKSYIADSIPVMTSNTGPSGIASASSIYNLDSDAYKAFDNMDLDGSWISAAGVTSGWLGYEFVLPVKITKYTLIPRNNISELNASPKSWTFEGYDGASWTVLDTKTNVTKWQVGVKKEISITNTTSYKKYRINITQNNGNLLKTSIGEMEMISDRKYGSNLIIPTITSNVSSSGTASASSVFSSEYDAYRAFDNLDLERSWNTPSGTTTGWLAYEFVSAMNITKYTLLPRNYIPELNASPKSWTFEGYNGTNWIVLDTQKNIINWQVSVKKEFPITNSSYYKKYRININQNNGHLLYTTLGEMEMMGFDPNQYMNILSNPGFENGLTDWSISNATGGTSSLDTNIKFSGSNSLKITPATSGDQYAYAGYDFGTNISGRIFTMSAYVKTLGITGTGVHIDTYWKSNSGWIWQNVVLSPVVKGNQEWTRLEVTSEAPIGATRVIICVRPGDINGQGTFWVDSLSIAEKAPKVNLLNNPGFENGTTGWSINNSTGGTSTQDETTAFSGNNSLKITRATSGGDQYAYSSYWYGTNIGGRTFTFSAYVKTEGITGNGVYFQTYWLNDTGWVWKNITNSSVITGTNGWSRVEVTAEAPEGAKAVTMIVRPGDRNGQGTFWIDSLAITENEPSVSQLSNLINYTNYDYVPGITLTSSGIKIAQTNSWYKDTSGSLRMKVKPSTQYTFKTYQQINSMTTGKYVTLQEWDVNGNFVKETQVTINTNAPPTSSMYLTKQFQTDSNTQYVSLRLARSNNGPDTSEIEYKELSLVESTFNTNLNNFSNLLGNSDFEKYSGINGVADGWMKYLDNGAADGMQMVTSPISSGLQAQKIASTNIPINGNAVGMIQIVQVDANRPYVISSRINVESLTNATAQIFTLFYDSNDQVTGTATSNYSAIGAGYTTISLNTTTPANSIYARMYILLRATGSGASGVFYVDSTSVIAVAP